MYARRLGIGSPNALLGNIARQCRRHPRFHFAQRLWRRRNFVKQKGVRSQICHGSGASRPMWNDDGTRRIDEMPHGLDDSVWGGLLVLEPSASGLVLLPRHLRGRSL
jgi:hypothetical protein